MPDRTRECPSCALEAPTDAEVCPFCNYEFPVAKKGIGSMAIVFVLLMLLPLTCWALG